jgi:HTH-type transcriptional regulator / antitoxin HipB
MLRLSSYVATIGSIHDLAAIVRGRRLALGLSQQELAARAKVSRQWISAFEQGRRGSELHLVVSLLEALDLRLTVEVDDAEAASPATDAIDLDALLEDHRGG